MRILILLPLIVAVAACTPARYVVPERVVAPPVPSNCDAICTSSCVPAKPEDWPQWECEDPNAPACWDEKDPTVTNPLKQLVIECDRARGECVKCLERLDRGTITCGVAVPCGASS